MKVNVDKNAAVAGGISLIVMAILLLILGPLWIIWSWNHLFGEYKMFDYTFLNWFAVIGLGAMFKVTSFKGKTESK